MLKCSLKEIEDLRVFLDGVATIEIDEDWNYISVISCQDDIAYIYYINRIKFPEDDDPNFGYIVYFYFDDCFVGQILFRRMS